MKIATRFPCILGGSLPLLKTFGLKNKIRTIPILVSHINENRNLFLGLVLFIKNSDSNSSSSSRN
jgi:hypothetical protein